MPGQKWDQVIGNGNRSHPRPTAPVRNAERLVQIEMTDVGSDVRGSAQPHHRVHVRPIHVDLSSVLVNDATNVLDGFFKHAMR